MDKITVKDKVFDISEMDRSNPGSQIKLEEVSIALKLYMYSSSTDPVYMLCIFLD